MLPGPAQEGADGGEHLTKFIVEFSGDVPERGFLRGDELLGEVAALRGEFGDVREEAAVVTDEIEAGKDDGDQDCGKEEVELALDAIVDFGDANCRSLFGLVILDQETRDRRTESGLARLQRIADLLRRCGFEAVLCESEHARDGVPELPECLIEVKTLIAGGGGFGELRFSLQRVNKIGADALELRSPGDDGVRFGGILHIAHGETERVKVVLDTEELQGVAAVAVHQFALQFAEASELKGDICRVGQDGEDGDEQAEVEAACRGVLRGGCFFHYGEDITRAWVEPTRTWKRRWYTLRALSAGKGECTLLDVGLVGFGLGGKSFHAPVIQAVKGLRVAAIVQRTGDEAKHLYPEARVVRSLDRLLEIETIQLVVIATPNQTHFPFAKRCLEAGRDVVVDKPFTNTVEEAVELVRTAKRLGRVLTVYHDRRFDADFQALREVMASGELGRIVRFEAYYDRFRPKPRPHLWREIPGPGSGILADLGPHLLDYALTLFGVPERVTADVRIERDGFITDDAFDVWLHYQGGPLATVSASMLNPEPRSRFIVLGTKGSYLKKRFDPLESELRIRVPGPGESWMLEKPENFGEMTFVDGENVERRKVPSFGDWRDFYANVRDCILGTAQLLVTPAQAVNVMIALELARESSEQRCSVAWRHVEL